MSLRGWSVFGKKFDLFHRRFRDLSILYQSYSYTQDEKTMLKTFDAWDILASSVIDIDAGVVGRKTVSDACLLRATASLGTKIGTRKQLFWLEQWLRDDIIEEQYQGDGFFQNKVQPASLALGQFRNGSTPPFGYSKGGKIIKLLPTFQSRFDFLRELINGVVATKDIEMIVLELLLRAGGSIGKPMALTELEQCLCRAELLALYFAFVKPTASRKYAKCFQLLDAIEGGKIGAFNVLSDDEKLELRNEIALKDLGATASGKRLAIALLKRLNRNVIIQNGKDITTPGENFVLEPILPIKATKKAWGDVWPEKEDRAKWIHVLGNLCLVSEKVPARDMKLPFSEKKDRYRNQVWPLTSTLDEVKSWDEIALKNNVSKCLALVESIWG
jgi:hypothetical protein